MYQKICLQTEQNRTRPVRLDYTRTKWMVSMCAKVPRGYDVNKHRQRSSDGDPEVAVMRCDFFDNEAPKTANYRRRF